MDSYVGIDVALERHRCAVLDSVGEAVERSLSVEATCDGFAALVEELRRRGIAAGNSLVGLEAAGHLWENLEAHLTSRGCQGKLPAQALTVVAVKLVGVLRSTLRHRTLCAPSRVLVASS